MITNKKRTFEQHDNESINFYRSSIDNLTFAKDLENNLTADIFIINRSYMFVFNRSNYYLFKILKI